MPVQFSWKQKLFCIAIEVFCGLAVMVPAYFLLAWMFDPERGKALHIILLAIALSCGSIAADLIRKRLKKQHQRYE